MANDFREHLDTARLWWDLDEAVLYAIAGGQSTREPFRAIALYVIDLKAKAEEANDVDNTAALAKIAIRVAGTPGDVAAPTSTRFPRQRLPRGRLAVITILAVVALIALITAAAAANMITLPVQVEDVFNKIGIPLHSDRSMKGLRERDPNHAAPIYIEDLAATKMAPAGVGHHREPTPKKHAGTDGSEWARGKHRGTAMRKPRGKAGKGGEMRTRRPTPKPKKGLGTCSSLTAQNCRTLRRRARR